MTKGKRRLIFWVFVVFFSVSSADTIFLAQGWRFDFESLKFSKTGGIYIQTSVDGAKIYINDKLTKSTKGLLNYSVLISDLTPKNYNVFIYKEGYYPWNKTVAVESGLVSEMKNILLIPLELSKTKITEISPINISSFSISENEKIIKIVDKTEKKVLSYDFSGKNILTEKYKPATSSNEILSPDKNKALVALEGKISVLYLKDSEEKTPKKTGTIETISEYESTVQLYDWINDSEHVVWFSDNQLNIAELDNRGGKRNSVKFYLNISSPVFFDRQNSGFYYFETSNKKLVLYKLSF